MQITPNAWTGPGSGTNQVAPTPYQVVNQASSTAWAFTVKTYNSSGVLVTVASWSISLWDVTAGSAALTVSGSGVESISISGNMLTNGHVYTYAVSFASGTCDHCIATTDSIAASGWKNLPLAKKWDGSSWVEGGGPRIYKWNGTAWVAASGNISKWNGTAWVAA
jgi:hypothetical protein